MEALILASLISAFLAGLAALFAPCCIGVLLPAYFASIFRQKRTVLLMTLVFFLGLLTVFIPLGLGVGFIGAFFKEYHTTIYLIGATILLALGGLLLLGYHFSLPFHAKSPAKVTGAASVYSLGIFSGFATLCCAPVLAGALTLSLLPGSVMWGGLYAAFYALGMVFPLFIISYFLDKTNVLDRASIFKKQINYTIANRKITVSFSNMISGLVFIAMSLLILYFVSTNSLMTHSSAQVDINILAAKLTEFIVPRVVAIPFYFWIGLLIIAGGLVFRRIKHKRH